MRPRRTCRTLFATVVVAAALGLVACGGDDATVSTADSTSTSSSTTAATTATTAPCSLPGAGTDPLSGSGAAQPVALLTDVRTGRQACADRVVFDFRDAGPGWSFAYEPGPFTFGESGLPIDVDGAAFLVARFSPAAGVDLDDPDAPATYTGPERVVPTGLAHVREIRRLSDFEAQLVWVIGLDAVRPFAAATLDGPARVYLDVG